MNLTAQQRLHFELFGFLALPEFFDAEEIRTIESEYERAFAAVEPLYAAPIGVRGQINWSSMRDETPFLASALEFPRLVESAEDLLGEDAVGVMTNGNNFSGRLTEWHADTSAPDFRSAKFVAYLQPLDGESGALRVLPGSHRDPWHSEVAAIAPRENDRTSGNPEDECSGVGLEVGEVPSVVCDSRPGDAFVFDLRTWHASCGGKPNRKMCSFTYFQAPRDEAGQEGMRQIVAQLKRESAFREARRQREWRRAERPGRPPRREPQYSRSWLENAEGSERRARWLRELVDWGLVQSTPAASLEQAGSGR
ncbi:MAG TPA: phytanoyl-CoA dioxygenase family protein [Solirubrobacterales bacterium]|jgi:hypothetical protein